MMRWLISRISSSPVPIFKPTIEESLERPFYYKTAPPDFGVFLPKFQIPDSYLAVIMRLVMFDQTGCASHEKVTRGFEKSHT
jgi:hypothetical protein